MLGRRWFFLLKIVLGAEIEQYLRTGPRDLGLLTCGKATSTGDEHSYTYETLVRAFLRHKYWNINSDAYL